MNTEHLRMWYHADKQEEESNLGNWEKVITLIHAAFRGVELAALCAWKMVMMIPNEGGTNLRGIGLVEVLWKAIYGITNCWLLSFIQFHNVLYSFHAGRGTRNTTIKAKLIQRLIAMRVMFLHAIFLDL